MKQRRPPSKPTPLETGGSAPRETDEPQEEMGNAFVQDQLRSQGADEAGETTAGMMGGSMKLDTSEVKSTASIASDWRESSFGFGYCLPMKSSAKNLEIHKHDGAFKFESANFGTIIRRARRAPPDKTPITGPTDGAITDENRKEVAADLMPNSVGRAKRAKYYSSELVDDHETVHALDYQGAAAGIIAARKAELSKKTVGYGDAGRAEAGRLFHQTAAEIGGDLLEHYGGSGIRTFKAALEHTDAASYLGRPGEKKAYGAGRAAYQSLAEAIDPNVEAPTETALDEAEKKDSD